MNNKTQKPSISLLIVSKFFERISFYLIMAVLVLYLMESVGLESISAGYYYSAFYGFIFISTLFSGLIGDLTNRTKLVASGIIILSVAYLTLAYLPGDKYLIIIPLSFLAIGLGFISPNLIVLLGNSYNERGNEISGLPGFIVYSAITNLGALIGVPLATFLRNEFGFSSIFILASLLSLVSLVVFLKFKQTYNNTELESAIKQQSISIPTKKLHSLLLFSILSINIIIGLALYQRGLTFNMSMRDYLDDGGSLSLTFAQIEKYISILLLVIFALSISRHKKLTWNHVFKLIIAGTIISSLAFVTIGLYNYLVTSIGGQYIFIQAFLALIVAETIISPSIFYTIYRCSPPKRKGLFQGVSYIFTGISFQFIFLGALIYEDHEPSIAFIAFAIALVIATGLLFLLKENVKRRLSIIKEE